jgi:hypothetical protein
MTDGLTREAKALLHHAIERARGSSFYYDSKGPRCVIGFAASMVGIEDSVLDAWQGLDIATMLVAASSYRARRMRYLNIPTFTAWYPSDDGRSESTKAGLLERLQYLNDSLGNWTNKEAVILWMKPFMHHVVEMVPTITLYLQAKNPRLHHSYKNPVDASQYRFGAIGGMCTQCGEGRSAPIHHGGHELIDT